jgi:acetoin utilization deacetylase AcuC-like enzyme/GNAT superfamily N-acetyltransferase
MFRIRRIFDAVLPRNRKIIEEIQHILRVQFPLIRQKEIDELPDKLRNPLKHRFQSIVFVAEKQTGGIKGFALLMHEPQLHFAYLDYISAAPRTSGTGIGGVLYERVRREAMLLGVIGIFMECLPDDPALCPHLETLRQNRARLRFYERYGAVPVIGTAYETPLEPDDDCPPYLVFDNLGQNRPLGREEAKVAVRAILERKYADLCSPQYVDMVVDSFQDDPVRLRPPRYASPKAKARVEADLAPELRIVLVVNDRYDIHHVRERGYVEAPVRIPSILRGLESTTLFERLPMQPFPEKHILAVHDRDFYSYLKTACQNVEPGRSLYPYVFPIRNTTRPPKELTVRAGYYCIDTFTPLNSNAFLAARCAVDATLTAAAHLLKGRCLAYALVRPPGHHAERRSFGGFCYFNSNAIAAQELSKHGRVAILDVDYHHGNGQQDIFFRRNDVLTVSIHGEPNIAYPYFSGFAEEVGEGEGTGFNLNIPLPEQVDGVRYVRALEKALDRIRTFKPDYLVVALGLDTAKGDPTGSWSLSAEDLKENGTRIGALKLPTLVVQEGGYRSRTLGSNARAFLKGLWAGAYKNDGKTTR